MTYLWQTSTTNDPAAASGDPAITATEYRHATADAHDGRPRNPHGTVVDTACTIGPPDA